MKIFILSVYLLFSNIAHYIIGIDEAGRGPWAGPVVVGGFLLRSELSDTVLHSLRGVDDSKKLKEKERERIFYDIERLQFEQECQYTFAYREAYVIDMIGIREANRECMWDAIFSLLQFISHEDTFEIFIDGCDNYRFEGLDIEYIFAKKGRKKEEGDEEEGLVLQGNSQRSIQYCIHGDALISVVSVASIVAKVIRDRMMSDFHEEFPFHGFKDHKGYGTRKHHEALINYGITPIHRKSYAPVKTLISSTTSV